jgi:hypothetical protein
MEKEERRNLHNKKYFVGRYGVALTIDEAKREIAMAVGTKV